MTVKNGDSQGPLTDLQISILDEASDFPEPVWQLVHGSDRSEVRAALASLLERNFLELVLWPFSEPLTLVPPAELNSVLDDDSTWQHPSPVHVRTTDAGDTVIDTVFQERHP